MEMHFQGLARFILFFSFYFFPFSFFLFPFSFFFFPFGFWFIWFIFLLKCRVMHDCSKPTQKPDLHGREVLVPEDLAVMSLMDPKGKG